MGFFHAHSHADRDVRRDFKRLSNKELNARKEKCFLFCFFGYSTYEDEHKHHWSFIFFVGGGERGVMSLEQRYFHVALPPNFMHNQDITFPLNWLADYEDRILGSRPFSQVRPGNVARAECQTAAGIDSPRARFTTFKKTLKNNYVQVPFLSCQFESSLAVFPSIAQKPKYRNIGKS